MADKYCFRVVFSNLNFSDALDSMLQRTTIDSDDASDIGLISPEASEGSPMDRHTSLATGPTGGADVVTRRPDNEATVIPMDTPEPIPNLAGDLYASDGATPVKPEADEGAGNPDCGSTASHTSPRVTIL